MKIKIKQTLRSMWATILAILMILSTFSAVAVTLNVESTGAITGNIYFDNTKTQYSSVYVFLGHSGYLKSYKMTLDSDNIWKTETSFNNEWNDATNIYFASSDGGVSGGSSSYNMSTSRSSLGLTSYTNKSSTVSAGTSSCYVPDTTDNNSTLSIMSVEEAKASHSGGTVSDDIISVLNGTKIMFYAGVLGSWGSSTIYVRTGSSTTSTALTLNNINNSKATINNVECYYGVACLSSAKYYISNSTSWSGVQMGENAVAGKYYILNNSSSLSGNGSNNVYANAESGSATTTISSSNVVSTSFTAGKSGKGTKYDCVYYIKDSSDTYSQVGTSASEVNSYISGLEDGTYTLYTCSTDKTITVLRDTDTFTVAGSYNVTTGVKVSTDGSSFTVDSTKTAPTGGGDVSASTGTTLTASEISGYTFVGWEVTAGATISSTNMSVSYTPTADTTVYAKYSKNYTVSIGTHTNGTITVDGEESNKTVPAGTSVTIVASPSSGYAFSAWTGDLSGESSATVTKTVTSDITVNATFAKEVNYYYIIGRLTIKDKNGNSVSTGSTSDEYSTSSTNIPFELVDEDAQLYKVVTQSTVKELSGSNWYFRIRKGTATAANGDQYNPSGNYDLKSSATSTTLSVGSSSNLRFQDSSDTSGPVVLWFNAKTLKFYYTIATNSISYVGDANGDFTDKVTEASPGTTVEVKPNPNTGYVLDTLKYNDGSDHTITLTDGKYTFTMPDSDVTVTATFKKAPYTVTLTQATGGTISGSPLTDLEGSNTITLTAAPSTGYKFTKWKTTSGSATFASDTSASTTATVTDACTITAEFTQLSAATSLEVTATPSSCKVGEKITLGKTGTVESDATLKYEYSTNGSDWSTASANFVPSSAGTYQFRVTASKTGYKTVTSSNSCSVTVSEVPYVAESVTLAANHETVEKGNAITLTAGLTNPNATSGVKYSFYQTSSLAGSFSPESVTGIDTNEVTFTPTVAGEYKFTVTASCAGYNDVQSSEITVTVTAPADVKADAFSEGMWIDAQPGVADSADAMVKPYFGTSGKVKFYLPNYVNLSELHIYHKYGYLEIAGAKIESGSTVNASSWTNGTVNIKYGDSSSSNTSATIQVFQSTAKTLFTSTSADMPTTTKSSVTDATTAADYKKQCSFSGTYRAIDSSGNAIANNTIKLKGRGNSSWEMSARVFGKYAYNITLGGAVDLVSASGKSTASKKWSMLANNVDEAMMRNMLVYNLSDAIGLPDSPMSDVYNVYNNGTYLGSYQMSEKVEVGSGLLVPGKNVDKLNEGANTTTNPDGTKTVSAAYNTDTQTASNGNLKDNSTKGYYKYCAFEAGFVEPTNYKEGNYLLEFELDERFPDEVSGFISNYGQQVVLKSPEYASRNEVLYAMDRFNFAEAVIYYLASGSTETSVTLPAGTLTINGDSYSYTGQDSGNTYTKTGLDQLIDVENFAKAYLIQEFTENLDGVATSFYVDITAEDAPLVSKPVWDFDWTMGQYGNSKDIGSGNLNPDNTKQWFIRDKYIYKNSSTKNIIATLCSIESFWATVKNVWNGTSSASLLSTGSSSLFPVSALMGKKASLNPIGAATGNSVYTEIQSLYGANGKIKTTYSNALESSVVMNEDRYGFISNPSYSTWGSKDTGSSWTAAVDYLDNWANERATWMNARLNDVPEEKKYLYFKDEQSSPWSTVNAHIYSNSGSFANWPGTVMEKIDSQNNIWRVEYTGDYTNVIFNYDNNNKTGDNFTDITTFGSYNMLVYSGSGNGQWHWETYQETGTYKVNKATTTNGSFTVSRATANQGDNITITASPSAGFVVDTVIVTGASGTVEVTGTGNTRTFTMPAENVTVSVTFKAGTASDYVVYLDNAAKWANPKAYAWNGGDGTTDKNGDWPGVAMNHVTGNIYMLTFTKEYANIIFSNDGANKTIDLTLENGKIYNNQSGEWSVYNPNQTITVSAGTCTGGSVTINGSASVSDLKLGDQITLTANASDGYAFTGWNTVTGLSITDPNSAQTSASVTSVDADIEVTANFSSSKSGYYIKGTFNEWKDTNPLYTTSGNVTTTTIKLNAGTYKFKVYKDKSDGQNEAWYGNEGTITDTTTTTSATGWTMYSDKGDCTLEATGGTYTFTFDTNTKKLIITKGAAGNTATVISQDTDGNTLIGESLAYISSYTKVGESTPSANTTSSVNDIKDGTSVIFTAPTNQYYTFKYWLVNGVQTDPTETDGVSLKIDNVTYDFDVYAVYDYITSDVAIATGITNGTVTTDKTTAVRAGEVVTISLTPASGYSTKTVVVTDADGSNIPVTGSANKYTFVMPNKNVTVSATFAQADTFTVTYASNDNTMGTVSADFTSGSKFENGTSLTVTANALDGYMFAGWYSDAQLTTKVYDNTPYTFTVSGDTSLYAKFVIAKGDKDTSLHAIFKSGNNNPSSWSESDNYDVYKVVSGSSYADAGYSHMFDIDLSNVEANKEFYFALSSSTSYQQMYWTENYKGTVKATKDDPNSFLDICGVQHYGYNGTNYYFPKIKVSSQNLLSLTGVTVYVKTTGTAAGEYLVVPKGKTKPADTVTIYAKNGTLKTTYAYGTTTVTGINEECVDFTSLGTPYSTYYGLAGDRIIAQTEVNATQAGYGWYVYAYVINGVEYLATKVDGTDSTYQMDTPYIVQEGQDVEITPIYLNTNIEKEDGYVTLYVDPNDLGDHWGNTISVYSYYYVGSSTENAKQMNSAYPGEPMMLESTGLYKAFIPKDAWEVTDGVFAKVANCPVSGLTLNNYMEGETVHQNFLSGDQKKNYQTYDYDDFKVIAEAGYDTVKFDVKYRTNTTNQYTLLDNANDHPVKTGSTIDPSTYYYDVTVTKEDGSTEVTSVPEWEDLTDIDGNLASIVGFTSNSVPSGETFDASEANKLYIVSTGNQNTSMGEWSTVWYVYDHTGNYITQGLPSDFIPRYTVGADGKQTIKDLTDQTDAYQAIYTAGYEYTSALIAYESEQNASTSSNSGNSGTRLDGRWYYARSDAELSVTTHVLYTDTNESATKWSEDTYNSDLTGAYTGALATVEDVRDKTVSRNTSVTISASPSSKGTSEYTYKFVGWATNVTKNDDGTYTPTKNTTLVDSTSIFSVVSDTDVYALYVPVGEGDLVVNHSAYSTVNSGANGGTGRYFVQAVVTHNNDTTDTYYAQNGVTVPIKSDDQKVDITLYTVSTNGCSYVGSYVYNGLTQGYNDITANGGTSYVGKVNPASAPATVTHTIRKDQLFDNAKQLTKKLDYYSDLKTNTITVKLNYYDRKLVNGSPADISDKETTYTYKPATYPSSVYEKNAEGELVLSLSNLITYTVSNAVKPDNALDDYYYWPSQSEAVTAMSSMYNYHTGAVYGETPYHTDHYGNVQDSGDKWVTYYKADGTEIAEGDATAENVSTISIWYFNTPKKYSYTMSLATDSSEIKKNTSGTYYYGTNEVKGTKELLYNQRLGGEDKTSTGNEASEYLQAYGVTKGYVDIKTDTAQNLEVTEQDAQGENVTKALKFVGWATDTEGKNIVSTNYKYGLRITGNVKVYAIYGETELNHPGVNVQGVKPEQYFDEKNVSKTRISTTFTPYNCEDNDPNIANIGIVYLRVANSTTEKALENISDEDLKTLRYNIAKVVSKAEYSSFKSGTVDSEASATIVSLSGSTASGFKYKVVDQISDSDTDKQAVLSNKNTGQITQIFSTSVIKGYTYYTFATMGYKNYPADSTDDSVYTDAKNVVTYITSDNFAKFEFNSNGVCVTEF